MSDFGGVERRFKTDASARLMFFPEGQVRVYLYGSPCDMRKSFNALIALTKNTMGKDPLSGHLFVFVNRRENYLKTLSADRKKKGKMQTAYFWPVMEEKEIKEQSLTDNEKLIYRLLNSKPVVDKFFAWVKAQLKDGTLLPSNRLTKALNNISPTSLYTQISIS